MRHAHSTPPSNRLTWPEVTARRLERQGLARDPHQCLVDAAIAMGGVHVQVQAAGEVSLALRTHNATRGDVRDAVRDRHTLVRTFGPRGTVHLLAARDLPMWVGALSALPPNLGTGSGRLATADQAEEIVRALGEVLSDAELTVDEVTTALADRVGDWAVEPVMPAFQGTWPRWRAVTALAAHRGVLCFGAPRGRKVTYTNPQRFLTVDAADPETALRDVLRRYLHVYGPATPEWFARWIGAPVGWAIGIFERNAGELEPISVDGTTAWINTGDTATTSPARGVRLLPYFDAYGVGTHPREVVFPGQAADRALNRGQAGNYPVLLIDGVVAGVWHQQVSGRRVRITVEPLAPLTNSQSRELDAQLERLEFILDARASLTIGTVSVGPHA